MTFYDLPKPERDKIVVAIHEDILNDIKSGTLQKITSYFSDEDTYIRKAAYLSIGKLYYHYQELQGKIILILNSLSSQEDFKIRQTAINAAGEIGKSYFERVQAIFDKGLFDTHHSPRNAVIGSMKKMGEVNPASILQWVRNYLHHPDKEIRREICHGIELRGRTHPEDILPLLKELEHDKTKRVRNTLVHVLGQIAYKKNCLAIVVLHLKSWENKQLVADALEEIIDVHHRYSSFAELTQEQARKYIADNI